MSRLSGSRSAGHRSRRQAAANRLGYRYLGNWEYRAGNANVEIELLTRNLQARGYSEP